MTEKPTQKKRKNNPLTKVMTPEFRVSFPHVFKAQSSFEGQEAKYSIQMLFKKTTDLSALKKAVFAAATDKFGPKEDWPKGLRLPFRDGNEKEDMPGYKGCIFVSASSKQTPGVIDQNKNEIITDSPTPNGFYAGCYARATLNAFAYDMKGNKGVSFGLNNIQKLRDGEPFSGRKKAEDEFDSIEEDSENPDSYDKEFESEESLGL